MYLIQHIKSSVLQKVSSKGKESLFQSCKNVSSRLPNTVNLHVQTGTKTECVVLVHACLCAFECFVCWRQTPHIVLFMHVHFCACMSMVLLLVCPFCIHECQYLNAVSVHAWMHTFTSMECESGIWYVRAKQIAFFSELWTSWVHGGGGPI